MENKVKLAIVYYSSTGTNHQMAQWAKEEAEKNGAEVRLVKVQELVPEAAYSKNPAWKAHAEATVDVPVATSDDLVWADAILFSAPSRYGTLPAQMKFFIDGQGAIWAQGLLVNKVVSAMSSAQNVHGGQEATILSLYTNMYHWGAIVVSPGYTDPVLYTTGGNPYGASTQVDMNANILDNVKPAVEVQVRRMLDIAGKLK
ncbi:NAD(P)H dehydrogenase [anaerobic digester metagenome]